MNPAPQIPVLLATASSGGAIAAVRNLGKNGIKVNVLSSSPLRLDAAAWSRFAARTYSSPPEKDPLFLDRLVKIGAADPGQLLMPTSDETAWLYTENAELLGEHFRLYQPSPDCLRRILDKKLLGEAAAATGVSVLSSWEPSSLQDVVALAPSLPYPILIKPRTHVHRIRNDKGIVVCSAAELIHEFGRFTSREAAENSRSVFLPDAQLPILQQFVWVAQEGVCSVTGFIDRTGELFVTRRATKILQRSQPIGVGVCFESLPADPALADAVRRLCRELGYFGMFEVEFLRSGADWAIIDFNPRLFNQAGMDIRRGMPLPLLAYLDATGATQQLRTAVADAQNESDGPKTVFCDQFTLNVIILARSLTGRMSRKERANWRDWRRQNSGRLVDTSISEEDPMPARIHAMSELCLGLKAIPKFLRATPRALGGGSYASVEARP